MPLRHKGISSSGRSLADLVHSIEEGDLGLDPPYQRGHVWSTQQRVNLIKSIMLGIPIAAIVLNRRDPHGAWTLPVCAGDPYFVCIDGKQRLTAVRMWLKSELSVPAEWFDQDSFLNEPGSSVRYDDLTPEARRFFRNVAVLPVAEAKLRDIAEEAEVYELINVAGTAHTEAELERARVAKEQA